MIPISFDQCSGWFEPGDAPRGVVLCGAFGYEDLCARRMMTLLARQLGAVDLPTLRFDWHGCGDSLGGPLDPDRPAVWARNAHAACDWLRTHAGVQEIALVGLRLGALVATQVGVERDDVADLVLLAPPSSGRAWKRELQAFGKLMAGGEDASGFDGLDVAGFRMARETVEHYARFDWTKLARAPARRVTIFEKPGSHAGAGVSAALRGMARAPSGCETRTLVFEQYDEAMCDPTAARIPQTTLRAVVRALGEAMPAEHEEPRRFLAPPYAPLAGAGFVEANAQIEGVDATSMQGVFCRPSAGEESSKAVIFLNAGAVPHVGWARQHVDLARRLARHGVASLRLDLPGLGDSARGDNDDISTLYADDGARAVKAAVTWMKRRRYADITLAGACSGAYQAWRAALNDARVDRVALVNQLCFEWGSVEALHLKAWRATKARTMAASAAANDDSAQRALLDATHLLARLTPFARKVARNGFSALVTLTMKASQALRDDNPVESGFIALSSAGVRTLIVQSEGDASIAELERHMGPNGEWATALPGVERIVLPRADHMLTSQDARETYADVLVAFMDREIDEARRAGATGAGRSEGKIATLRAV